MLTCKLQKIFGNSSFVLDNHIQLDLYSANSLKQQYRYVTHKASHRANQSLIVIQYKSEHLDQRTFRPITLPTIEPWTTEPLEYRCAAQVNHGHVARTTV
jgi:hypothetical protein